MGWRRFVQRDWWDKERAREIDSYLQIETAENIARGMAPAEAAAAARRKFGNPVLVREEIYRMNSIGWIESLWQDLRYGARQLRLSPGFTLVAIVSLALGIGANTAIFQLLNAVRLRSLPVHNPRELAEVRIAGGNHGMGVTNGPYAQLTRPIWQEVQRQQETFSGIFAWGSGDVRVGKGGNLQRADGIWASVDFFPVLGVQPWRGRFFLPEDEASSCPESRLIVSYSYWQSMLGGRESAIGDKLMVNGRLMEVIGVTPPRFLGIAVGESFDLVLPFCQEKEVRREVFTVAVLGRLRPGWTIERASAQLGAISAGIFEATAPTGYDARWVERFKNFRLAAYPASGGVSALRATYDSSLWILLAITGLVLLIACANLANLMLARTSARGREVAVRLALGASRGRLLRQFLMESGLLSVAGTAIGIGLAQALSRALVWSLSTESASIQLTLETDWRVLLFAAATAAMTCVVFGVVPALRATRSEPLTAMKSGGRGMTAKRERISMQRVMVVTQVAVSLVLLVSALLFMRSFRNLMTFDPGMRENGIAVAYVGFHDSNVPPSRYEQFKQDLVDEVRSTPGVLGAATTTMVPLLGGSWGHGVRTGSAEGMSMFTWVSPGYFKTMGISVVKGRDINLRDTANSPRVALVNRAFERRFLGGANPIGQTLRTSPEPMYPSTVYEIIGVIADTSYNDLRGETPPMAFAPASQYPASTIGPWTAMMIQSNMAPTVTMASVKRRIAGKHPEITVDVIDFQTRIRDGLVRERLLAMLSGFFGLLAALLATVGLYGVISYIVTRRRNEIGIRVALGARREQVIGMVMREAGLLLAIGITVGIALSLTAGRSASSLLFGLKAHDPITLIAAGSLLTAIAAGASYVPARRGAALDPVVALRAE